MTSSGNLLINRTSLPLSRPSGGLLAGAPFQSKILWIDDPVDSSSGRRVITDRSFYFPFLLVFIGFIWVLPRSTERPGSRRSSDWTEKIRLGIRSAESRWFSKWQRCSLAIVTTLELFLPSFYWVSLNVPGFRLAFLTRLFHTFQRPCAIYWAPMMMLMLLLFLFSESVFQSEGKGRYVSCYYDNLELLPNFPECH